MLLSQQIGMGNDGNIDVAADVPDSVQPLPLSIRMTPADALPQTNDYRLLQKNVEARVLEKRMAVGSHLPKVAIGGGWVYHNVLDRNHNFGVVMATVDIPCRAGGEARTPYAGSRWRWRMRARSSTISAEVGNRDAGQMGQPYGRPSQDADRS